MCDVQFKPATQQAAEEYFAGKPPFGFRGYVAELDGKPVGVGGIFYWGGLPVVFSQMKDELRAHKRAKAKAARLLQNMARQHGRTVYAVADRKEPTSQKLLAKLGFVPTGQEHPDGPWMIYGTGV